MVAIWVIISFVIMLSGIAILFRSYFGFRSSEKVLCRIKDLKNEDMITHINSYLKRNYYYGLVGTILIAVSSIIMVLFS